VAYIEKQNPMIRECPQVRSWRLGDANFPYWVKANEYGCLAMGRDYRKMIIAEDFQTSSWRQGLGHGKLRQAVHYGVPAALTDIGPERPFPVI